MIRGKQTDTLEGLIRAGFDHLIADVRVALPGRIESFNETTRLATIKPMLSRRFFGAPAPTELPVIQSVPLIEMRTQRAFISLPVAKGDPVLMVFSDRALDNWIGTDGGMPAEPLDVRTHDITDAFAILGGWPILREGNRPGANPKALDIQVEEGTKVLIGNGTDEVLDLLNQIMGLVANTVDVFSRTSAGLFLSYSTHAHSHGDPTTGVPTDAAAWAPAGFTTELAALKSSVEGLQTSLAKLKG